jgi:hypothetical protein
MRKRLALCVVAVCVCLVPMLSAQDAVKTDPKHDSVVSENDQVRILKVHYGPHEVGDAQPSGYSGGYLPMPRGSSASRRQDQAFDIKAGTTTRRGHHSSAGGHGRQGNGCDRIELKSKMG